MIRKIEDARSLTQRASGFLIASVLSIICLATCGAYAYADTLDTSANASTATTATEASAAFTEKAGALGQGTNDLVAQDQAVGDQAGVQTGDQAGNQPAGDSTGGQAADDQAGDKTDASEDQTGDKTDVPDQATTPVNKPERAGWMQDADGSWYYYKSVNAAPSKGWIKLHKTWYYLDPADNGKMKIGKFSDGKATYIAANSGAMYAKQWVKLDSDWYYASASGALKSGWQKSGGKWYWLQADQDGAMATSAWITDKNKRYYVDGKGVMKTGWIKADEGWYYANKSGAVNQNGWVKSGSKWYWLQGDKQGLMAADQWITDKNKRYYLSGSGVMATKWIHIGDDWFYANKSGAQQKGWVKSGGKWYWLQGDEQGLMAASKWITDKNKRYYLTGSGAMATKWIQIDQDWYYANNSGAQQMSGWVKSGSKWYWLDAAQDGKMATSAWVTDKGKRYYLGGNGVMATKWIHVGNDWYYANKSGALQNGWVKSGGKWYWLQTDKQGLMAANENLTISGALYSFTDSGAMRTNTTVDLEDNKVGYATSSGAIVPVGAKENGKLVLRSAQGAPLTGWQKFGGAWFYGDEGGVAHTGWLTLKGKKYWLDDNGVMATGLRTIDGKRYVFSPSGAYVPVSAAHAAVFERAVKELERCTNASMTKEQKLRAAFNHIRDDFREYNPRIPHMKRVGWETIYADDVFIGRGGNCLSYAAAFAFMAKAIGYENVYACNRGHAWVEIDGRVYDPEWEKNHRSENYFNRAINASGGPGYTNKQGEPWMRVAI